MGIVHVAAQRQLLRGVRKGSPNRREPCAAGSVTEYASSSRHDLAGYLATRTSQGIVVAKALRPLFFERPGQQTEGREKIIGWILAEQQLQSSTRSNHIAALQGVGNIVA
ncbi:hypothetical protein ACU4HD_44570 (plasmid) [Cupriavidus basilensis]